MSALALSRREWRAHFASAFGRLEAAKRTHDPGDILTPGYEIFSLRSATKRLAE